MNLFALEEVARLVAEHGTPIREEHGLPVVDSSPRGKAIRRISEIANLRGWQLEVTRAMDTHNASYVSDLSDRAVFALRDRMEYLEDCVQYACDPADAPPAR